ncbi:MAG: hypothetical protein EXR72_04875 [Myxococcales bacterium]|nr:hypothetical protein [Myxococcales bacterium]
MRTTVKMSLVAVVAALGAGCGGAVIFDGEPGRSGVALSAPDLPACGQVTVPPGEVSLEDVAGSARMVVQIGRGPAARRVCEGTLAQIERAGLLDRGPRFGRDRAENDPMPADGEHPDENDPMPAHGGHPADNDPMPAQGDHPVDTAGTVHTPAPAVP